MGKSYVIYSLMGLGEVISRLSHAKESGLTYQADNEQLFIQALDQSSKVKVLLGEVLTFSVALYGLDTGEGYAFARVIPPDSFPKFKSLDGLCGYLKARSKLNCLNLLISS